VRSGDGGAAIDGSVEEVVGVGWAPMTDKVRGELLQLEEWEG
jgi:hypothetical protein